MPSVPYKTPNPARSLSMPFLKWVHLSKTHIWSQNNFISLQNNTPGSKSPVNVMFLAGLPNISCEHEWIQYICWPSSNLGANVCRQFSLRKRMIPQGHFRYDELPLKHTIVCAQNVHCSIWECICLFVAEHHSMHVQKIQLQMCMQFPSKNVCATKLTMWQYSWVAHSKLKSIFHTMQS